MLEEKKPMDFAEFRRMFLDYAVQMAATGNCYPLPALFLDADGSGVEMAALACPSEDARLMVIQKVWNGASAYAYGLDRYTKPGQDTTRGNVFTYAIQFGDEQELGCIFYDNDGTVDAPVAGGTPYWTPIVQKMHEQVRARIGLRVKVTRG